jgi:hypothetical protein
MLKSLVNQPLANLETKRTSSPPLRHFSKVSEKMPGAANYGLDEIKLNHIAKRRTFDPPMLNQLPLFQIAVRKGCLFERFEQGPITPC